MKDSGKRRKFPSGAVRDRDEHKPRPDLISPFAQWREGEWLRAGAVKYNARNWEAGMPISECVASISRHVEQFKMGDTTEDHMAAIRCNAGFILHYKECIKRGLLPPALDDMPRYLQQLPRPIIYVAGPLSADTPKEIRDNRKVATAWGDRCYQKGWAIYVPHSMTEHWFKRREPEFNDYSLVVGGQDFALLHRCAAIIFCPDWKSSKGAKMEHKQAKSLGIPMYFHPSDVPDLRKEQ